MEIKKAPRPDSKPSAGLINPTKMNSSNIQTASNHCAARGVAGARHFRSTPGKSHSLHTAGCGQFGCYRAGHTPDGPSFYWHESDEARIAMIGEFMANESPLFVKLDKLKKRLKLQFNITTREGLAILSKWSGSKANGGNK
jgi:hypothetical protein